MARIKLKFHLSRRQKLVFELGVAVLCMIMLLGALNVITTTHKVPILTTEDLWEHANTTLITFEFRNATDPSAGKITVTYALADVASYYDGYLYISIPYPAGYEVLRTLSIYNLTDSAGNVITAGYLVDHGVNEIRIYMSPINSTNIYFNNTFMVSPMYLTGPSVDGFPWPCSSTIFVTLVDATAPTASTTATKWKALFPDDNLTAVDRVVSVDVGSLAVKTAGHTSDVVGINRFVGDIKNLDGLKLKIEMYAVSEKPVLKAFTEPVYSFFAGLWGALVGVVRRAKSIIGHAFGGFSMSALFTGLIGNPAVAVAVTCFVLTLVLLVHKRKI